MSETPPASGKTTDRGLVRLWNATRWSFAGLRAAWKYEAAFRADALLAVTLFGVSFFVAENPIEWAILVAPLLLTMIVELLNSAIETTVDRIGVERHPLSGRAKDIGSAAVMLSLVLTALCWGAVLWSHWNVA